MAFGHDEQRVRAERARTIGLFRYALIREAADEKLSTRQRGRLVRTLAEREHDRPVRAAGAGGPADDRPVDTRLAPRRVRRAGAQPWRGCSRGARRRCWSWRPPLKREVPARTAVQIAAILRHTGGS